MAEFYNKNITYKGASDKGLTIQLIDEQDSKWTIWKKDYNDKTKDSEVYAQFKNLSMGEKFGISYGEKESSFVNKEGKTINFTQKTIYSILPVIDDVAIRTPENTQKTETPRYEAIPASQSESKEEFWDKKAYKQCLWNYWLETGESGALTSGQMDLVWRVFNDIEKDANERFSKPKGWAELGQKLKQQETAPLSPEPPVSPDIQELADEMEISGEQIPF